MTSQKVFASLSGIIDFGHRIDAFYWLETGSVKVSRQVRQEVTCLLPVVSSNNQGKHRRETFTTLNNRVVDTSVAERGLLGVEEIGNKKPSEVRYTCLEKCIILKIPFSSLKCLDEVVRLKVSNKAQSMRSNIKRQVEDAITMTMAQATDMSSALEKIDSNNRRLKAAVKDMQKKVMKHAGKNTKLS